jgi:hypothetical protein
MSHKTQTLKFLAHAVHSDSCACCLSPTLVPFVTGKQPFRCALPTLLRAGSIDRLWKRATFSLSEGEGGGPPLLRVVTWELGSNPCPVCSSVQQLSRLTNHNACQPSRHHRTASCLATCKGSFWRYACREFSHQRPPDIVTDHPHSPCMGSRAIFHAIQILMEPWFPMCWACFCDVLVPGAVELLPSSSRASRLLGWGAIGAEQGRKQVAPKTNGLHGSQTPMAVWQSPVSHNNGALVEVWKLED